MDEICGNETIGVNCYTFGPDEHRSDTTITTIVFITLFGTIILVLLFGMMRKLHGAFKKEKNRGDFEYHDGRKISELLGDDDVNQFDDPDDLFERE